MPEKSEPILDQLYKQNALLTALLEQAKIQTDQGKAQADWAAKMLWHTRNSTNNETSIRKNALRPLMSELTHFLEKHQLGLLETVHTIEAEHLSFARYGDGELQLMLRDGYNLRFQSNTPQLASDLKDVYTRDDSSLLLGLPQLMRDSHWAGVWVDIWDELSTLSNIPRYGNTHVTRPVFFATYGQEGVQAWRRVWASRDAVIVTGKGSRFDMLPELFSNLSSYRFVHSYPVDAYMDLDRILESLDALSCDIVLISLGPAGTLLAAELARRGIQAIDVGHISDSYLHTFNDGAWPESRSVTP